VTISEFVDNTDGLSLSTPLDHYFRRNVLIGPLLQFVVFVFSPVSPAKMDWSTLYPEFIEQRTEVQFADIGCGYGGLLGNL